MISSTHVKNKNRDLVLGIHFGHDSSICILRDGKIESFLQFERVSGVKHAGGIPAHVLLKFISDAGCAATDFKAVGITSTQSKEFIFDYPEIFSFRFNDCKIGEITFNLSNPSFCITRKSVFNAFSSSSSSSWIHNVLRKQFSFFSNNSLPRVDYGFAGVGIDCPEVNDLVTPILMQIEDIEIPGLFVQHHLAHVSSTFYKSGFEESWILTNDGGGGADSGFLARGKGAKITSIFRHNCLWGSFYDMASQVGFTRDPGKFMGLSAYGLSKTGDPPNLKSNITKPSKVSLLINHFLKLAPLGKKDVAESNEVFVGQAKFAALIQKTFEKDILNFVKRYIAPSDWLCLSGGSFLNCPTNSLIAGYLAEDRLYVDYSPNDEGLSFGAAALIYYHFGTSNTVSRDSWYANRNPYQGSMPKKVRKALKAADEAGLQITSIDERAYIAAAHLISAGEVGAIMRGKAEVGPRALGHRSIVAAAVSAEVRDKVNRIKNRELWRPLAPIVRGCDFDRFFSGPRSPYMLFVNEVKNRELKGVAHVDNSARVQVIPENSPEPICEILRVMSESGNIPVLINTSFNDRDVPMYDDALSALVFFLRSDLKFLFLDEYFIQKISD